MQVTIEVSDKVALQANRTDFSVQEFIMQAIQRYIHQEVTLVHTETWKLCGRLHVKNNLDALINSDLFVVTNDDEKLILFFMAICNVGIRTN